MQDNLNKLKLYYKNKNDEYENLKHENNKKINKLENNINLLISKNSELNLNYSKNNKKLNLILQNALN